MFTAWKVSECGVFSGPYFLAFGPAKTLYVDTKLIFMIYDPATQADK